MKIEYSNLQMISKMMEKDHDFFMEVFEEVKKYKNTGCLYKDWPLCLFLSKKDQIEICCKEFGEHEEIHHLIRMSDILPLNQERVDLFFDNVFKEDKDREFFIDFLIEKDYEKYKELIIKTVLKYEIDFVSLRNINPIDILKDKQFFSDNGIEYKDIIFENFIAWQENQDVKMIGKEEQILYIDYIRDLSKWNNKEILKDGLDCLLIYRLLTPNSVIKLLKENIIDKDILNDFVQVKKEFFYSSTESNYNKIDEEYITDYNGFVKSPRFFYIMFNIDELRKEDLNYLFNEVGLDFSLTDIGGELCFKCLNSSSLALISDYLNKKDFMATNNLNENLIDILFYYYSNNEDEDVYKVTKNFIKYDGNLFKKTGHVKHPFEDSDSTQKISYFEFLFDNHPLVILNYLKNKELDLNCDEVRNAFENLEPKEKIKLTNKKDFIYKSLNKLLIDFEKNTLTKVIENNNNNITLKNTKRL